MRVTKIIREYVEKRVRDIYGKETPIELEYKQAKEDLKKELEKANKEINEIIRKYAEENIKNPYGLDIDITSSTIYGEWRWRSEKPEIQKKADKAQTERLEKQSQALENIFVTLELGGNKAQLEEMLNNLK